MKWFVSLVLWGVLLTGTVAATAQELYRVSANEAFDAYAAQVDPNSGESARVILVDVRTRAEYFWVGTPAMVEQIVLKSGRVIVPDDGKVVMKSNGIYHYRLNGRCRTLHGALVESMAVTPIATSIPLKLWRESDATMETNEDFFDDITALGDENEDVVLILMCRSGKRSKSAPADPDFPHELFKAVYEIDILDDNARGGFEGSDYDKVYNGYRGFPGRPTWYQSFPSVSWTDAGLPIVIGATPAL